MKTYLHSAFKQYSLKAYLYKKKKTDQLSKKLKHLDYSSRENFFKFSKHSLYLLFMNISKAVCGNASFENIIKSVELELRNTIRNFIILFTYKTFFSQNNTSYIVANIRLLHILHKTLSRSQDST